jgi:hypothetical protein
MNLRVIPCSDKGSLLLPTLLNQAVKPTPNRLRHVDSFCCSKFYCFPRAASPASVSKPAD